MPVMREWELSIDADAILRTQGADPARLRSRHSSAVLVAEHALEVGLPLLEPAVVYQRFRVQGLRHERLLLDDRRSISGSLVAEHLCTATEVAVMVCTIGPGLEARASECFAGDPALGVAIDALGSAAVDALGAEMCGWIDSQAVAKGLQTTVPVGPGLIGWPVASGQRELFALVAPDQIGVTLTDGFMMQPHKSTSLVIGIGTEVKHDGDTCDYCSLKATCNYKGEHHRHNV